MNMACVWIVGTLVNPHVSFLALKHDLHKGPIISILHIKKVKKKNLDSRPAAKSAGRKQRDGEGYDPDRFPSTCENVWRNKMIVGCRRDNPGGASDTDVGAGGGSETADA